MPYPYPAWLQDNTQAEWEQHWRDRITSLLPEHAQPTVQSVDKEYGAMWFTTSHKYRQLFWRLHVYEGQFCSLECYPVRSHSFQPDFRNTEHGSPLFSYRDGGESISYWALANVLVTALDCVGVR